MKKIKNKKIEFHALIYALSFKKIKNRIPYINICIIIQEN